MSGRQQHQNLGRWWAASALGIGGCEHADTRLTNIEGRDFVPAELWRKSQHSAVKQRGPASCGKPCRSSTAPTGGRNALNGQGDQRILLADYSDKPSALDRFPGFELG
jgi:hypothetical protein